MLVLRLVGRLLAFIPCFTSVPFLRPRSICCRAAPQPHILSRNAVHWRVVQLDAREVSWAITAGRSALRSSGSAQQERGRYERRPARRRRKSRMHVHREASSQRRW